MSKRAFLSTNEAAAYGVKLAKPDVVSAYPITPQTTLVEKLADFLADGTADFEYMMVESEHSAMAAALGVSMMGARAFTATSSQGLLYMAEMLNYAAGGRHPIVMVNANRAIATPWNIYGDHSDAMSMRDCAWVMLFCESGQEALDTILQAYKLAEDPDIMLPVMINVDGFTLTHTYDVVDIPDQEEVDAYLPKLNTTNKMSLENPKTLCQSVGPDYFTEIKKEQQDAFDRAKEKIVAYDEEFKVTFGRGYSGLIEEYCCEDAERVLVAMGGTVGTTRLAVDELRAKGEKVGLIKLRSFRPFPSEYFYGIKDKFKAVGVIDRSICFGVGGTVYSEVKGAMYGGSAYIKSFIAGIGGRDISVELLQEMFGQLKDCTPSDRSDQGIYMEGRW